MSTSALSTEIAWVPVSASGPHVIVGNRISLPEGGVFVTLEARVSDWDPDLDGDPVLSVLQIALDQSGFTAGEAGRLSLEPIPCDASHPCPVGIICGSQVPGYCDIGEHGAQAWAFIDTLRPDYVFAGVPTIAVVNSTLYWFGAMAFYATDAARDVGISKYAGTLIVYVSPDARGRFLVRLLDPGRETWVSFDGVNLIVPDVASAEILVGGDCNANGVPDGDDIANGTSADCNVNGRPDECEPDCNDNGIADECDVIAGCSVDCDGNGVPDDCEPDCNVNGVADACDIDSGWSADCDGDGVPDECTLLGQRDCNNNGIADLCDVHSGRSSDCKEDGVLDECSLAAGQSEDCNADGIPNDCDPDCNRNGTSDACDIADGVSNDANNDGVPDECAIMLSLTARRAWSGFYLAGNELLVPAGGATVEIESFVGGWDPNEDGDPGLLAYSLRIDPASLVSGSAGTLGAARIPCATDADCWNSLRCGVPDAGYCEETAYVSSAAYVDTARPDYVFAGMSSYATARYSDLHFGASVTGTLATAMDDSTLRYAGTLVLDVPHDARGTFTIQPNLEWGASAVKTTNGRDVYRIAGDPPAQITIVEDCNGNGVLDTEDIAAGTSTDCDQNGFPDECDLTYDSDADCNGNLVPDICESTEDCNGNGTLDFCDLLAGTSRDDNGNGVPDECDAVAPISEATGGRYVVITPTGMSGTQVALTVTSPDYPCLQKYVTRAGGLSEEPTFALPGDWGSVTVGNDAIVPDAVYEVAVLRSDNVRSAPAVLSTPRFGDLAPPFGLIDLHDVAASLAVFLHDPCAPSMEAADLAPEVPDGIVDFRDISMVVTAYEGKPYPYATPCP